MIKFNLIKSNKANIISNFDKYLLINIYQSSFGPGILTRSFLSSDSFGCIGKGEGDNEKFQFEFVDGDHRFENTYLNGVTGEGRFGEKSGVWLIEPNPDEPGKLIGVANNESFCEDWKGVSSILGNGIDASCCWICIICCGC